MSPERQVLLVKLELRRWLDDERGEPVRGEVHRDRMARIMGFEEIDGVGL